MLRRLGRLIAHYPRAFLLAWLLVVFACFALAVGGAGGQTLFERLSSGAPRVPGEAAEGENLLAATSTTGPSVFGMIDQVDPAAPAVVQAVTAAATDLAAMSGVLTVLHPYLPAGSPTDPTAFVATDGTAVLVTVTLEKGLGADRQEVVEDAVVERLAAIADGVPGSTAVAGSVDILVEEVTEQVEVDLRTGELIALPVSLVVMVFVFGGFLAAGLPIAGALASIAGALGSLLAFSYLIDLDASVVSVVTVLGLGLSIDYGLLLASRYREELRGLHVGDPTGGPGGGPGGGPEDDPSHETQVLALENTLATAGRTVVFSAVTVAISLSGLMLFGADILRAVGAAGVSVVVVALLVAVGLVPTLLALAGPRMIRQGILFRTPGLRRLTRRFGDIAPREGVFSRLARSVQRRPVAVVLGVLAVLIALGIPSLRMQLINTGAELLPVGNPQRELFLALDERFPATTAAPIQVVAPGPPEPLAALTPQITALPGVASVDPVRTQGEGDAQASILGVRVDADESSEEARDVVHAIRDLDVDGVLVTGQTAQLVDFLDDISARAPLAVGLVILATFVLLFLMTGSVLIPVKALLMNIVSLGASLGILVWVFQDGHLEGLLDFTSAGGIDTTIPALVLAFGFGLAMDYEVFLLSRIKELRDAGFDNDEAVVAGLQRSGRIITSAALIIVIVFSGFVVGQLLIIKQTGVALAVAVAIDATLVRMLLVPATMTLLGEWNWWAPTPLRRLHQRFGFSEGGHARPAPVTVHAPPVSVGTLTPDTLTPDTLPPDAAAAPPDGQLAAGDGDRQRGRHRAPGRARTPLDR